MKRDSVRRNPVRSSSFKNTVLLFLKCVKTLMQEKGQSPFKKPSFREQQEKCWSVLVRMGMAHDEHEGRPLSTEQNVVAHGMPLLGTGENFISRGKRSSRVVFSYIFILPQEQK